MLSYVITAIISAFFGFMLCAILSANKSDREFTIKEIIERKEIEDEDE